jgi:hypothetical protein
MRLALRAWVRRALEGLAPRKGRLFGLEFLADLGHRVQQGLGEFLEHVELADLRGGPGEQFGNHVRVQRGTSGCYSPHLQAPGVQMGLEVSEKLSNVLLAGVVVEHPTRQSPEGVIVHDCQHAERPVVDFVGRQVAAEGGQGLVEILGLDAGFTFFPPPPRPSSGWWQRARRRGDPATGANWPSDRAGRPRSPTPPPAAVRDGCNGTWATPGHPCRR